jgi:hypothetical protein
MDIQIFHNIFKILERDRKTTTYKFALLRSVIETINDNSPYLVVDDKKCKAPLSLLVVKWIFYYYPLLDSSIKIPQINDERNLKFEKQLQEIIDFYRDKGGMSTFSNHLYKGKLPEELKDDAWRLLLCLRDVITDMPMKYIGRSFLQEYYGIFNYEIKKRAQKPDDISYIGIISNLGEFSYPIEYHAVFKLIGTFIDGKDSIAMRWAEFSVNASRNKLETNYVLERMMQRPVTDRDVFDSKKIYNDLISKNGSTECVWSRMGIKKFDIDHLIPYSIFRNNDLWNLMPADSKVNHSKKDKIPSPELIEKQKDIIKYYWEYSRKVNPDRFDREISYSLLGDKVGKGWKEKAIFQLQETCNYLINKRGHEEWNILQ